MIRRIWEWVQDILAGTTGETVVHTRCSRCGELDDPAVDAWAEANARGRIVERDRIAQQHFTGS